MIHLNQNSLQTSIVSKEKVAGLEKYGRMNRAILDWSLREGGLHRETSIMRQSKFGKNSIAGLKEMKCWSNSAKEFLIVVKFQNPIEGQFNFESFSKVEQKLGDWHNWSFWVHLKIRSESVKKIDVIQKERRGAFFGCVAISK